MFQASDIAEFALRFAGVTTIYDTAPDPEQFEVTLKHFNLLMAEKQGVNKFWWNVPAQQEILLRQGVTAYNIDQELSDGEPLLMVNSAHLVRISTGEIVRRLPLIRRWEFTDSYNSDTSPAPATGIYIERKEIPLMYVIPPPADDDYKVRLDGIAYPEDQLAQNGQSEIGFPDAWARCLSLETAIDIGSGPVVALPPQRIARLEKMAILANRRLKAYNNRENLSGVRYTKPRDF